MIRASKTRGLGSGEIRRRWLLSVFKKSTDFPRTLPKWFVSLNARQVRLRLQKTPASWLTGVSLLPLRKDSNLVFASALAFGSQFKEPLGVGRQKLRIDNREARYAFQINLAVFIHHPAARAVALYVAEREDFD